MTALYHGPGGSHQKNRREQKFASCSELGFRILPAGGGRGQESRFLVMELLLEAREGGRPEAQTQRSPLLGRQNHLLQGVEHRGSRPLRAFASWAWSRERWGQQDQGAARRALPGAAQV